MSTKMQVNRLLQDELAYELQMRGIATGTGTVDEMRHSLAMQLRLEKSGDSIKYPSYLFSVQEDTVAGQNKLAELESLVIGFENSTTSSTFLKLQSRLAHVMNRIDHIEPNGPGAKERADFLAKTLSLMDLLQRNADKFSKKVQSPESVVNISTAPEPVRRSTAFNDIRTQNVGYDLPKSILPSKWNLKLSGDKKGLPFNAFLERCEELRVARHVSKQTLLESVIDLFEGRAYQFYLVYRHEATTWNDFVGLMCEEYLSSTYDEKLLDEIKRHTQGSDKSIGIYLAVMTGYFKRLSEPLSDKDQLKIILYTRFSICGSG